MKILIEWLMQIEQLAEKLYTQAAAYFQDPALIQILNHSAEDEAFHHQTLATARQAISQLPEFGSDIVIDKQILEPVEQSFRESLDRLHAKSLTKEMMIDCMVSTEFSEWNDSFLYVVNTLKAINPDFKPIAAEIQHHLRHIEHYLQSDDYGRRKIDHLKKLEAVWKEKILIIDDNPAITDLMKAVLKNEGTVHTADNGEAGLAKIEANYYRIIISDVDMPMMDGITLFKKVYERYPSIMSRYLFISGNPTPETEAYFKAKNLQFLGKPISIHELKKRVVTSMHNIISN